MNIASPHGGQSQESVKETQEYSSITAPDEEQSWDSSNRSPNAFVRGWRKTYHAFGFNKGYNLPLFVIFAGAMLGFVLARFMYLDIDGQFHKGTAPSEWLIYSEGLYRYGITIHLSACLPAGLLMVWQFLPIIRYRALILHRINGYIVILLVFVSNAGALMIARRAFGGTILTQTGVGVLAIMITISVTMAYYNIKRLQIDQHRAWMLRTMFYMGTIITLRLIMEPAKVIIPMIGNYYATFHCSDIIAMYGGATPPVYGQYPACANLNTTTEGVVAVRAGEFTTPEGASATLQLSFGLGMWLSILVHFVGVEIYLHMTPAETARLRLVSYEKQLEAGMVHPGSSGLTSDRWGDAVWTPPVRQEN